MFFLKFSAVLIDIGGVLDELSSRAWTCPGSWHRARSPRVVNIGCCFGSRHGSRHYGRHDGSCDRGADTTAVKRGVALTAVS